MTTHTERTPAILLTRSDEDNLLSAPLFEAAGLTIVSLPGLCIAPPDDWSAVDQAIRNLSAYDGIIFTSRHAVHAFLGRLDALRTDGRAVLRTLTIAAVGTRTDDALRRESLEAAFVPDVGSGRNLVSSMSVSDIQDRRFLFPKSSIAREEVPAELRSHGAHVDEVVVYQTIPPNADGVETLRKRLADGSIHYAAFFSPSAVRNIVDMLGIDCFQKTTIAVIGPTTAAAANAAGLHATIIAASPQTEDLVAAIAEHAGSGTLPERKLNDT